MEFDRDLAPGSQLRLLLSFDSGGPSEFGRLPLGDETARGVPRSPIVGGIKLSLFFTGRSRGEFCGDRSGDSCFGSGLRRSGCECFCNLLAGGVVLTPLGDAVCIGIFDVGRSRLGVVWGEIVCPIMG
jgi:hypothetical protein